MTQDKHKPTVDDLHSKTFMIQNSKLKVDFLDTSGDDEVRSKLTGFKA